MAVILNTAILNLTIFNSSILVCFLKFTHICQGWFPPFAQKKLHSFILTQLGDGSHLEICHIGFRHLVIFSQIHSKNTLTPLWLWLQLIQSDSKSFILTQLDDCSHIEFCYLGSYLHKKNFTHSFWLNLMMAVILNSTILVSSILVFPLKLTHTSQD